MERDNAVAGISGGRTSARMAYMLAPSVVLTFQNTGLEHPATYDFVERLEGDLGRQIIRLEFRAPPRGDAPRFATFEIVDHRALSRGWKPSPFRDMLECFKTYRAKHKGLGPTAPWANSRTCTSHLKVKTQRRYAASIGFGSPRDYTEYIGLRADEPRRVAKMRGRNNDRNTDERAPLADAGITKADVNRFWSSKSFDLELPGDYLGNCEACFMKDEADLATALMRCQTLTAEDWISIEETYGPMRRGRSSYRQVFEEAKDRMAIRWVLEGSGVQVPLTSLSAKRHRLIVAQELERLRNGPASFACECDAAKDIDDEEEEAA